MLKQYAPISVTRHQIAEPRAGVNLDALENRWLHRLFLVLHKPASWAWWQLAGSLLLAMAVVWLFWLPLGIWVGLAAASVYLLFALIDWGLLIWLPRSGRSFGPIGPQLFVLSGPRIGWAVLLGIVGWFLQGQPEAIRILLVLLSVGQMLGWQIYAWAMVHEPFTLATTHFPARLSGLAAGGPPISLLHLSDLHVERLTRRENRLLELVEEAQPDLIVITGDYLNLSYVNDPVARKEVRKLLARLHAPCGIYAILGSPPVDPPDTTPSLFDGLAIHLLRDEVAVLRFADGRSLSLLALDCTHDLEVDGQRFRELVELAPPDSARVLLYHSPELMPVVQQYPVDLYLCGHTHGGQVRLPIYGALLTSSALGKRYEMGPYVENGTTLYISRGIGLEGLPAPRMRLLCPPEIILFTLEGEDLRL
jgi:predicted MPP superfamily phosphohydrolase